MKKKAKKRLALIGTNGIPASYGGGETFFENLTKYLADKYDITIYCSNKTPKQEGNTYLGAKLKYYNLSANGWQSIPYDILSICHAAIHSDILYVFGFGAGAWVALMRFFGFKKKVIFNHGGLNEWRREKYPLIARKTGIWGRKLLRNKVIHVVDNKLYVNSLKENFDIENAYVIRYGGDNAKPVAITEELKTKYPFLDKDYYVSVARSQPDNNLHVILEAFAEMPEKRLVLISNFKSNAYGLDLFEKYQGYHNISMIPGVYDQTELNAIRSNAIVYIHTHSQSGTPPSLCEAMYLQLPIISFDTEVNREVTQNKALFFRDEKELETIIKNLTSNSLTKLAKDSKMIADKEYTWQHICDQYCELFES